MKIVGLWRHAKSDWGEGAVRDFDRRLNERGCRGAKVMGEHVRDHGIAWDRVVASPATRVCATLQEGLPELDVSYDQKLYLASADTIMEVIEAHAGEGDGEVRSVLVSGHNPGLLETILELVAPARENDLFREAVVKFPTGAFAVLECDIESWDQLKPRCAKLVHFARPRDFDPELGPEG
ncbi:SixA phosphatase family protein [Erythrobacter sp.]|jgi:phosphohistidine phosphatase|uniref:SixA phosphatase family protein n=1 Tax=Erythrobacter sp. TaxID=1042 RepID=UPI002E9C5441|nr:histidine phosphatase family protein [Erythrobacter sp.]